MNQQSKTNVADSFTPETEATIAAGTSGRHRRGWVTNFGFDRFGGLWLLAVIIVIFGIWVPDTFLTVSNLKTLLGEQAITAIIALGVLVPLAAGIYDLSVAANMGLSVIVVTHLQSVNHMSPVMSVVIALLVAASIGGINAFLVTALRVNSFIATLGMSSILGALVIAVSNNEQIVEGISTGFREAGQNTLLGISYPVYYAVALALILWYILEQTPGGRYLYSFGANPEAARLSGIKTTRLVVKSLVVSGLIGGIAGVVFAARIGTGSLEAGPPYLLPAFAAVFLGSTQIKRGRPNVLGTLIAVILLATGVKGLQLVGVPLWVGELFNGVALIVAVALAAIRGKSRWSPTG